MKTKIYWVTLREASLQPREEQGNLQIQRSPQGFQQRWNTTPCNKPAINSVYTDKTQKTNENKYCFYEIKRYGINLRENQLHPREKQGNLKIQKSLQGLQHR